MKLLYYDCFAGISGDMHLGALVDLGVPFSYLQAELNKLQLEGYTLECSPSVKMGISGTRVKVHLKHHEHPHRKVEKQGKDHPHSDHRNLDDIRKIITASSLSDFVKTKSMEVFQCIAEAEAKIHAKPVNEIHFHEVGAIDSIVDIVGSVLCIEYLRPDRIVSSRIELGGGFVECAHGIFPVPAPATAEILKGIPVKKGTVDKETTTPTGAAILKIFVGEYTDRLDFRINKTAYGIGHRDLTIPNVLRVYEGEIDQTEMINTDITSALLIECNIDDMNPEHYEFIMEKLFDAGAQDVYIVPIIMKKSRPAVQLSVLCSSHDRMLIEKMLLLETTSLGIRYSTVTKSMLPRTLRTIETIFGPVRIKEAMLDGKRIKFKAEYDDCVRAARSANVSLQEVYRAVNLVMDRNK